MMIDKSKLAIDIQGVDVHYHGFAALRDTSIQIEHGTFSGVIGMNGAGKSTLFKVVMGLVRPTRGRAIVCERTPRQAQKIGCVAYVPQSEQVDWDFPISVYDVVMMGRYGAQNIFRSPRGDDRARVEGALERVGMAEYRDRQIGELSGGQRKRVFVARALAQGAEILLLDEPFAGVDAKSERALTELLVSFKAEGKTIILSTHELTSLTEYCDHVALVKHTVVAYGPTEEVFTRDLVSHTYDGIVHRVAFAK
ncbi:MAG: chelated iron transport system membrane protein [Parcubacteria group bacterium GW2011_GWA2_51_10]|nr:MAG: chelated iron transport system membrane protein [Parcubacteria group bacterium GW2011_GWA2_51_10]